MEFQARIIFGFGFVALGGAEAYYFQETWHCFDLASLTARRRSGSRAKVEYLSECRPEKIASVPHGLPEYTNCPSQKVSLEEKDEVAE